MHAPLGSQCKSFTTGVIWSDLLIPEKKRAAKFWTRCSLSISRLGKPQY